MQWLKEKGQKDKQRSTKHTHKAIKGQTIQCPTEREQKYQQRSTKNYTENTRLSNRNPTKNRGRTD